MANAEKRLRVSVDTSQLRAIGGEMESIQRRIVENNDNILRQQNDAINQLREQLNLLGRQNSERGRQPVSPVRPTQPTPQPEEGETEQPTPTRRKRRTKQDEIDSLRGQLDVYQTGGARAIDLNALLGINKEGFASVVEAIASGNGDISGIAGQILQQVQAGTRALEAIQEGIFSIDETLYNGRGTSGGGSGIQPIPVPTPTPVDREPTTITRERQENVERGSDRSTATNIATRVISGVGATFQSPAAMGGGIISSLGGILGEGLSLIPGVGGFLGGVTTAIANVVAGIFTTSVEKAMEAQKRTIAYSQTMGTTAGQSMATAFREGSYASSALGMNVGEYIQRRAELIRAAGGKEATVAPVPETQSLMAVQRLYGLSDQSVMGMQGAMRFARTEEGQTASSSAIIRSFEQTMKQLQIPLSEIASTMDESMTTFVRSADDILSRTGEIDAANIAAIMRAVRLQTGMEGRQLERVQESFMGQGISQDEVTQTLLFRAAQQATGSTTPSEILAALDDLTKGKGDENVMKRFLDALTQMAGGSLETLRHLMRGAFTKLTYTDINALTETGTLDYEKTFEMVKESSQALQAQNDPTNRYEPTAAERTVTAGERMMSAYENRMIGIGETNIDRLGKILNALNALYNKLNQPKEEIAKSVRDTIVDSLMNPMKGENQDVLRQTYSTSGNPFLIWKGLVQAYQYFSGRSAEE
nr:MAG TPA: hypothetical protein [Caudoviricetes sp.]